MRFKKIPPVGEKLSLSGFFARGNEIPDFPGYSIDYFDSGTSALAASLLVAKQMHPEKTNVIIPTYCCPDVVSAVKYADLTPILVDLEKDLSNIDRKKLSEIIDENTLAVVAINFCGIKEQVLELKKLTKELGAVLIEDSAQLSPWQSQTELVSDYIVVSFGRGKPESVLEGGAVLIKNGGAEPKKIFSKNCKSKENYLYAIKYFIKCLVYNIALNPIMYHLVSTLPLLHVGKTVFKPLQNICGMSRYARRLLSERIRGRHGSTEIVTLYNSQLGLKQEIIKLAGNASARCLLRYPILLPNESGKRELIKRASHLGVSEMYPSVIYKIPGLEELSPSVDLKHAESFAARIATLPCHSGVSQETANDIVRIVKQIVDRKLVARDE